MRLTSTNIPEHPYVLLPVSVEQEETGSLCVPLLVHPALPPELWKRGSEYICT